MIFRIQNIDLPLQPFFVLQQNSALTANFLSSLFQAQADLIGSYSYPVTMPLEPNQAIIRNAQILATDTSKRTVNVMFWLASTPYKQCKFYFTIETDQNGKSIVNGNLYIDLSLIVNQLKTIKLNELLDPNINDQYNPESLEAFLAYVTMLASAPPGLYPYVFFPYKNDGAYVADAYTSYALWRSAVAYGVGNVVSYNNRIYQCIAASPAGDDPVSWLNTQMVNVPQKWEDITVYPDIALPVSNIINRWEINDSGDAGFVIDTSFPVRQTYTPFFYLPYVLYRVAAYFGFTLQSSTLTQDNFKRITIFSNIPVNYTGQIADYWVYMPALLVSDFIKELRSQFGLMIDFDPLRKVCVVESLDYLQGTAQVVDLQNEQTVQLRETGVQSQAFTIEQPQDSNDKAFTDADALNPVQLIIGSPATAVQVTDLQLNSAPTKMIINQTPVPVFETLVYNPSMVITNQRIPWIKYAVAGTSPMDQISSQAYSDRYNFKLRFLFYHGMQPDDGGYNYPYGSSDNLDVNGNVLRTFNLSLVPAATDYQAMLQYYTYITNSKPLELVLMLSKAIYAKLYNYCRVVIRDRNNASISCLLSQIQATFANNKDSIATRLTLYPKVQPNNLTEVLPAIPAYVPPPPYDNGTVYARQSLTNPGEIISAIPPHYVTHVKDLLANFFADLAATIPKDVIDLTMRYQVQQYHNTYLVTSGVVRVTVTSAGYVAALELAAPVDLVEGPDEYTWVYTLLSGAAYTVIP